MKGIITAVIAGMMTIGTHAQSVVWWDAAPDDAPVTLGVRGGLDISSGRGMDFKDTGSKFGGMGGVSLDFNFVKSFGINSGLFFVQKGVTMDSDLFDFADDMMVEKIDSKITANFIQLPVYASYRLNLTEMDRFQFFFGPYFEYGIYGKATTKLKEINGKTYRASVNIYDDSQFKRFQMGLGLGIAMTHRQWVLGVQYQWNLTDIASGYPDHWNNFNISIGYNFNL